MACLEAGEAGSHGFALAKAITDAGDSRELTATGTMYRALHRLDAAGLVESWWEDPHDAADAGRPRRRNHRITEEVGRPVASAIAAIIVSGLGVVLLAAGLARPVSPVIANAATIAIAAVAVIDTANHYILDALVGATVALVGLAVSVRVTPASIDADGDSEVSLA